MLEIVKMERNLSYYTSHDLKDDKELALAALDKPSDWVKIYEKDNADKTTYEYGRELRKDVLILKSLSYNLRDDEEIIMAAVKYHDKPLKYASSRIRNLVKSVQGGDTAFEKLSILKMTHYKSASK